MPVRHLRAHLPAIVVAVLAGSLLLAQPAAADQVQVSETPMIVDHVAVSSNTPYMEAKKKLESRLGRLDDHIRQLLRESRTEELRAALQSAAGKDGLVIHYIGVHGDWLILKGKRENVTEYFTGNVLSAVEMTSVDKASGLYAPLRIVLYQNARGGSTIEYDKPSTQLRQFHSPQIDAVARSLDDRLSRLCTSVLE